MIETRQANLWAAAPTPCGPAARVQPAPPRAAPPPSLVADFGQEDRCVTQLVFGGDSNVGRFKLRCGTCAAVLGIEHTHGGRRVRSWLTVFAIPPEGGIALVPARTRGVRGVVDQLGVLMQPRKHREPGSVSTVLSLIEELEHAAAPLSRAPSAYWRAVCVAVAVGKEPRRPTGGELRAWRGRGS